MNDPNYSKYTQLFKDVIEEMQNRFTIPDEGKDEKYLKDVEEYYSARGIDFETAILELQEVIKEIPIRINNLKALESDYKENIGEFFGNV